MRLVYHYKKETGITYVYEVTKEYWDKEKKQMRNKQRCIGKLDPETGKFIPSKRLGRHVGPAINPAITATTTITGPSLILQKVDKDLGLSKILKKIYPDYWAEIMSLAWYIVSTGKTLTHADIWCAGHEVPYKGNFSRQHISVTLDAINKTKCQQFFTLWEKKVTEIDYFCYYITPISFYSEQNDHIHSSYNFASLSRNDLAVIFGQKSLLPVNYYVVQRNLTDKKTPLCLLDVFDDRVLPKLHLIMDQEGFFSLEKVEHLLKKQQHFTLSVPTHMGWIKKQLDIYNQTIDSHLDLNEVVDGRVYAHTVHLSLGESKQCAYLHLYFGNPFMPLKQQVPQNYIEQANEEGRDIYEKVYQQLFKNKWNPNNEYRIDYPLEVADVGWYKSAGFNAILTSKWNDAIQALEGYREKKLVEKAFYDLKNDLDMDWLENQIPPRIEAILFIQFIALILFSRIRKILSEKLPKAGYTVNGILMELETLTTIHYSDDYKSKRSKATKKQQEILEAFNIGA